MKHITKGPEPQKLSQWKLLANPDWTPSYDNLDRDTKWALKAALMTEQAYLCCYCESSLDAENAHIEHFRPQSDPEVDPLDYQNLLCSCQNRLEKGAPRHCGNLKGNWFDQELLISPLTSDCETRFGFVEDGRIEPAQPEDNAALQTINRLGLDIPKLCALRKAAIAPFLDESLTKDDIHTFAKGYLQPDSKGKLEPFHTTIRYLFYSDP